MSGSAQKITLRDVAVLAFALCVLVPASAVHVSRAREQANRIKCASNLRQIGQAIMIYANANKGAFPRTPWDTSVPDPVPTEYTGVNATNPFALPGGPGPNDVSSALYLLLRTGPAAGGSGMTSEPFICPASYTASRLTPPPGSAYASFSNFSSRAQLSYGYTNPYPSTTARSMGFKLNYTLSSDFAIAADMGPGPAVAQVPANAPRNLMITANSPNHAGDGQNALYADGHVDWSATPFCGSPRPISNSPRDNIYAFGVDADGSTPSAGVRGAPKDQYDTVVLPSFDMGQQPGPIPTPGGGGGALSIFTGSSTSSGGVSGGAAVVLAAVVLLILAGGVVLLVLLLRASRPGRFPPPPGLA